MKADTISAENLSYTAGTLTVALGGVANNAQGLSSQNLIAAGVPVAGSPVTSSSLTLGASSVTTSKNPALLDTTVAPNTAHQRIGSFTVQAGSSEGVRVTSVSAILTVGTMSVTNLSNLTISDNTGSPLNPVATPSTNNFSINNLIIPLSQTHVFDVYADIGSNVGTVQVSTFTVTAVGSTSNTTVSSGNTATGQTITVGTPQLYAPTLTSDSPVQQYVTGGSQFNVAKYTFVSTTSPATLNEVRFTVTGTSNNIVSIAVKGSNGTVYGSATVDGNGVADIFPTGLVIPTGLGGAVITAVPTYATVAPNGGVASGATSIVTLDYVKATIGNTVVTPTTSVGARTMTLVASKPTVTIDGATRTGLVSGAQAKLASVTVSADAAGPINIDQIPLSITTTGGATLAAQVLVVRSNGGQSAVTNATTTSTTAGTSTTSTVNVTFCGSTVPVSACSGSNTGYRLNQGETVTFDIYGTVTGTFGGDTSGGVTTALGSASNFKWTDVNGGGTEAAGTATLIFNYSTSNTSSITNN